MGPFHYPAERHQWRHGPRGYLDLESFRPWLRDEFGFRCVYCLKREQWDPPSTLHIDHFHSLIQNPLTGLTYENLRYACARCNQTKSKQVVPDPLLGMLSTVIRLLPDGALETTDDAASRIIEQMRLNNPKMISFRRMWMGIVSMAEVANHELYETLLGYPDDLPDLRRFTPPAGNDRSDGIDASCHARRARGELPRIY
jgi:5-methylcytosine-specific restriction endonuclease McrA